jgi:hypothetical protein
MQRLSSHNMNTLVEPSAEKTAIASACWQTNTSNRILLLKDDTRNLRLKPFTTDRLLTTVEEVLRESGSARPPIGICPPVLSEIWSRIQPTSHWGINE